VSECECFYVLVTCKQTVILYSLRTFIECFLRTVRNKNVFLKVFFTKQKG